MNTPQLERLHAQMVRLRLFKSRERIEALLQEATTAELSTPTSSMACSPKRSHIEDLEERHHADESGPLPIREEPRCVRLPLPALDRSQAAPDAGQLPLHR